MSKKEIESNKNIYTSQDILHYLDMNNINYRTSGLKDMSINTFCPFNNLKENAITWAKKLKPEDYQRVGEYSNMIVFTDMVNFHEKSTNFIFVENLKATFFRTIKYMFSHLDFDIKESKIEDSAIVLTENIGENLYVGHQSFIDKDVSIGDNVTIMNNVVIQGNVSIGNSVFIESGSIIGVCGFGYYMNNEGKPEKVHHLGKVMIGNNVTIGAATCICRGSLDNTVIEDNVKIDNLCHIAHSVHLKDGAMVAACAEISGSAIIGENTWIAPNVSVINGVTVGNDVSTGIATNIVKNVPDNVLIYGNPGKIKEKQ